MGMSPHMIAPRIKVIRDKLSEVGRDPNSVKVFASFTPIIGKTKEEAEEKYQEALKNANEEAPTSAWTSASLTWIPKSRNRW